MTGDTLHSILNRFRVDQREVLMPQAGAINKLSVRREGMTLVVSGRCRLSGTTYGSGEYDDLDLLRLSIPEPMLTFVERYIPIATSFSRATRGAPRSLGSRAGDLLVPTVDDGKATAILAAYEPVLAQARVLSARRMELELEIDAAVAEIYKLTPAMASTLAAADLPAERAGSPVGGEE
jgi:hypothetical protein